MAFPTFREMIEPLLRVLAESPGGISSRAAQDLVADRMELSDEDREIRRGAGRPQLFRHRTNWAHDRLKRAGLSSTPRRGEWQITDRGLELARRSPGGLGASELRALGSAGRDRPMAACSQVSSSASAEAAGEPARM